MRGGPAPKRGGPTATDPTERLRRQARLFEQIAATTPDFIYAFDLDGRFLYANQRLLEVWGRSFEDAVGKSLYELGYPQWHADMHMRELRQVIETRQPIKGEVPFTGGSGISGVYEYIFTPVLGPDGAVEFIAGTTRDVTDRQRAEERSTSILESITDAFFALDREWRFTYLNRQAQRVLDRKADDMLGKVLWDVYPALAGSEFEKVYRRVAAGRESESFNAYYPDHDRWYEVHAYPGPDGISVYFRDASHRKRAEAELRDVRPSSCSGPRPTRAQNASFARLTRPSWSAKTIPTTDCSNAARNRSSLCEGKGATFTVTLPLTVIHPDPSPGAQRRHPDAAPHEPVMMMDYCPRLAGVKVLVVDDEPDARGLIKRLLDECDGAVQTAGSAAQAMELIQSQPPDVLISDIGMPGEDGYTLIRRVRALGAERGGRVPALALTAYARSEDRMRAVAAGYQMHVAKPVEPAELVMMVASLAGKTG